MSQSHQSPQPCLPMGLHRFQAPSGREGWGRAGILHVGAFIILPVEEIRARATKLLFFSKVLARVLVSLRVSLGTHSLEVLHRS